MPCAEGLRRAYAPALSLATAGAPPLLPRAAGGLSGRPRCRIFPVGRLWVLEVETPSGWLLGSAADERPERHTFPTLAAAVAYAEGHGFDYRIITANPVAHRIRISNRVRMRRVRALTRSSKNRTMEH